MLLHPKDLRATEPTPAWEQQSCDSEVLTPSTEKEPEKQLQRNQSHQYIPVLQELAINSPRLQQCRLISLQVFCCSRCTAALQEHKPHPALGTGPVGACGTVLVQQIFLGSDMPQEGLPGTLGSPGALFLSWGTGLPSLEA